LAGCAIDFSRGCARIEAFARQSDLAQAAALWQVLRAGHDDVVSALQALRPGDAATAGTAAAPRAAVVSS